MLALGSQLLLICMLAGKKPHVGRAQGARIVVQVGHQWWAVALPQPPTPDNATIGVLALPMWDGG